MCYWLLIHESFHTTFFWLLRSSPAAMTRAPTTSTQWVSLLGYQAGSAKKRETLQVRAPLGKWVKKTNQIYIYIFIQYIRIYIWNTPTSTCDYMGSIVDYKSRILSGARNGPHIQVRWRLLRENGPINKWFYRCFYLFKCGVWIFLHVKLTSLPKNVGWRGLIENMGFNGRFWHDNIKKWNIAISSVGCPVAPQSLHFLKFRSFEIPTFFATSNWTWYCGWKKSCTTWDDRKPINNGDKPPFATGDSDFAGPS